jgi:hypothetical protein
MFFRIPIDRAETKRKDESVKVDRLRGWRLLHLNMNIRVVDVAGGAQSDSRLEIIEAVPRKM